MKDCCIEGCKTSVMRDVMTFEFPTSRVLRKKWLDAISPEVKLAPDARVCLRHFTSEDYEAVRGKLRLRGKVVPTLFGEKAQSPQPPKDPLDQPNIEEKEPQEIKDPITDNHNGNVDNDNGKCDNENVDNKKCGKENSTNKDTNGHNDNENNDKDNEKYNTNENDNGNNEKDNKNEIHNVKKINNNVNKRTASKVNRKVKKKWVPMRHRPDDRDSLSEDSVNSDEPPPPILEDLEEHLPNYQIANMKTERQIAAMTEELEPLPEPVEVEECMEPHVPVFIELSVGQDNNQLGSEQPNDCLMVLESVQCDIDPTLMLEARAEDEDCCEQIDLDDDDDDDDDDVPAKTLEEVPTDPISLLTSSDEDDVIIQEPHIDTLSVSDATDEDDVPLQKLIKKEKKTKKLKKKKKREAIQSILVGVSDFYCYHCQHVSTSRSAHDRHVKGHLKEIDEQSQGKTRVYQICKECGFTTSSKSQLVRHQRKHLNEKRYKCPLCTYRSKYNMSLMYHLKTHNYDPNMYNCGACGLKLDSKKALLKHQGACYELGANLSCDKCSFKADTSQAMKLHKNTIHK